MGDQELYDIFCELLPDDLHDFLHLHNAQIQRWDLGLLALQRYLLTRANTRPPVGSVLCQAEPCHNCVSGVTPDDTRVVRIAIPIHHVSLAVHRLRARRLKHMVVATVHVIV